MAGNGSLIPPPRPPPGDPPQRMQPQPGPGPVPIPGLPQHAHPSMLARSPPQGAGAPGLHGSPGAS